MRREGVSADSASTIVVAGVSRAREKHVAADVGLATSSTHNEHVGDSSQPCALQQDAIDHAHVHEVMLGGEQAAPRHTCSQQVYGIT